jgi:hypothetical protein
MRYGGSFFIIASECVITKVHENEEEFELNEACQLLVYADDC